MSRPEEKITLESLGITVGSLSVKVDSLAIAVADFSISVANLMATVDRLAGSTHLEFMAIRAEMTEMKEEIGKLATKEELWEVRNELRAEIKEVKDELSAEIRTIGLQLSTNARYWHREFVPLSERVEDHEGRLRLLEQ